MDGIYMYIFIVVGQIVQNAISTFRLALTARDEKLLNSIMCFVQSVIGITVTVFALTSLFTDPMQAVWYIIGGTLGNYFGMLLEEKLALGQNILTIIVNEEKGKILTNDLRDKGFAVTVLDGKGIKEKRSILMIAVNRRKEKRLIRNILKDDSTAVILDESVSTVGGYL